MKKILTFCFFLATLALVFVFANVHPHLLMKRDDADRYVNLVENHQYSLEVREELERIRSNYPYFTKTLPRHWAD